ncbi:hypothetical protein ATCVOR07043_399L [Acanthocystis turfacea Chlorella virus OR0704.3]|nr:hypothetical protein ATCVOR07043_399L [Acanthocystis turfacea Chlorella virus OR0704.3]
MTYIMSNSNDTREIEHKKSEIKRLKAEIERKEAEIERKEAEIERKEAEIERKEAEIEDERKFGAILRDIEAELKRSTPIPKSCAMSTRFFN